MAKIKMQGMDEYRHMLESLSSNIDEFCGRAIFAGAKVAADTVKQAIAALPIEKSRHATPDNPLRGVTSQQKQGLLEGMGIAKMTKDGDVLNVKIGFDGYNSVRTRKYPKGQPNALIARSVNSGTSIRVRTGFMDKAIRRARKPAIEAMRKALDKAIQEKTKGR